MPKPGVFCRWESTTRYYLAGLEQDLLDDWVVVQRWGGKATGLGSHQVVVVGSETEGLRRLVAVAKVRARRGYRLVDGPSPLPLSPA